MSNIQVQFKRGDTATLNNTPITDGMIYFNTENQHIYMDNGSNRLEYKNDMSNFINKATIQNLVSKNSDLIKNPREMDRIIGNFYGETPIINQLDSLYQNKSLFELVWEDKNPQPFDTKTIEIEGEYPFYFILMGDMIYKNNKYYWYYGEESVSVDNSTVSLEAIYGENPPANEYVIILNNNTIFTQFGGCLSSNRIKIDGRKIQITSDGDNSTFIFSENGIYINGILDSATDNTKHVPYKIIGIKST